MHDFPKVHVIFVKYNHTWYPQSLKHILVDCYHDFDTESHLVSVAVQIYLIILSMYFRLGVRSSCYLCFFQKKAEWVG